MENGAGVPENLENKCILSSNLAHPTDKSSVGIESAHGDMLFYTDWKSMEWTNRLLVLREVLVEVFGA